MTPLPDIITKARARLLVRAPFLGSIALGLFWIEAAEIGTMATDGSAIWFNAGWCERQGVAKIIGVIAHEVLHIVNKHHLRRGDRQPKLWNVAADLLINRLLVEDGYDLPADLLFDRERRFAGLPTETIYARLLAEQEQRRQSGQPEEDSSAGTGSSGDPAPPEAGTDARNGHGDIAPARHWGEVRDLTTPSGAPLVPSERRRAESDLDLRIRQAAAVARRAGKLGGTLEEMIAVATDHTDWRDRFRSVFDGTLRGEASWSRPNRRFIQHGLYLPGWRRTGPGRLAFVLDTSGSISARELSVYTAAVLGILEETAPEEIALIQCDTEIRHVEYLKPGEGFSEIQVHGRGGTRFQPAFDWIAESGFAPSAVVYATDLFCSDVPKDPGPPVIWLTPTRGVTMSFGEVVQVKL
jgi:predicted metal-dependent peptidase